MTYPTFNDELAPDVLRSVVDKAIQMKKYGAMWADASELERENLEKNTAKLAGEISGLIGEDVSLVDGVWWVGDTASGYASKLQELYNKENIEDLADRQVCLMKRQSDIWKKTTDPEVKKKIEESNDTLAWYVGVLLDDPQEKNHAGEWISKKDGAKLYSAYGYDHDVISVFDPKTTDPNASLDGDVRAIVIQMQKYSKEWNETTDPQKRKDLEKKNVVLKGKIEKLTGKKLELDSTGAWRIGGELLYDKYPTPYYKAFNSVVDSGYVARATTTGDDLTFNWDDGTGAVQVPTMSTGITQKAPTLSEEQKKQKFPNIFYGDSNEISNMSLLFSMNDKVVAGTDWYRFDRWYTIDLDHEEASGRHYIFVLRPDLNLVNSVDPTTPGMQLNLENGVGQDTFFQYLGAFHPEIIASLTGEFQLSSASLSTYEGGSGNQLLQDKTTDKYNRPIPIHSYMPFLTGRVESLQMPDYTIKNYSLVQPYTRYTIPYASSAIESQTGGTFDLTLRDDSRYSIRKLFYAWIYYMDGVMRNRFQPKSKYILYNAFDYATSIYDIMVDATGENIIWWAKYTGCFPTSVPISDLSFNKGSNPDSKVSIPFVYYHYEPLDIAALMDLNYNSLGYSYMQKISDEHASQYALIATKDSPLQPPVYTAAIYNGTVGYKGTFLGKNQVGRPVVFAKAPKGQEKGFLKLRWLPMPI